MLINIKWEQMWFFIQCYVKQEIEGNTALEKIGKFELNSFKILLLLLTQRVTTDQLFYWRSN